jgi:pyruvate,water dikinase
VLVLTDPDASDAAVTGAKAANLARAAAAGLPTAEGFVLTTEAVPRWPGDPEVRRALRDAWTALVGGDADRALVVRSSSTVEDSGASSMAGQFTSVVDVRGWPAFEHAVRRVIGSADQVGAAEGARPMAVLVQRQIDAELGGVMFGVDPVTGADDHVVIDVVGSRPDRLVGGTTLAGHYVLTRRGRVVDRNDVSGAPELDRRARRRLVRLAHQTERVFGSPQDVEWCRDRGGRWWLLQSRPVTAVMACTQARSRLLGPGPVAETFPAPLRRLEVELWLEPLRDGISRALRATGAVSERALDQSPVVVVVGGWAAVDLELVGIASGATSWRQRIDPRAIVRRVGVAWRVGRLRASLPTVARSAVATVDAHLLAVPRLDELDDRTLVEMLGRSGPELAAIHRLEVLAGMLLHGDQPGPAGALVALASLRRGHDEGLDVEEILVRSPEVLTLAAPALAGPTGAADAFACTEEVRSGGQRRDPSVDDLGPRESLRLRARWLQELRARLAEELAARLEARGVLADAALVRDLSLAELVAAVGDGAVPGDLSERALVRDGPPLPPAFRLAADGSVLAETPTAQGTRGLPAGGGRAVGVVRHRLGTGPARDVVLVVQHLEPQLAPLLPCVAALVAETGSPLSHLAILAREQSVPTVVAVSGARRRLHPGMRVLVDGTTGDIQVLDDGQGSPDRLDEAAPAGEDLA